MRELLWGASVGLIWSAPGIFILDAVARRA
jgi:hypothetical protein